MQTCTHTAQRKCAEDSNELFATDSHFCVLNLVSGFCIVDACKLRQVKCAWIQNSAKKNETARNIEIVHTHTHTHEKEPHRETRRNKPETRWEKKIHKTSRHFQRLQFQSQRKPICFFTTFVAVFTQPSEWMCEWFGLASSFFFVVGVGESNEKRKKKTEHNILGAVCAHDWLRNGTRMGNKKY